MHELASGASIVLRDPDHLKRAVRGQPLEVRSGELADRTTDFVESEKGGPARQNILQRSLICVHAHQPESRRWRSCRHQPLLATPEHAGGYALSLCCWTKLRMSKCLISRSGKKLLMASC